MNCIGPMARSAEDLALLYSIIAGPDGADTDVAPVPVDDVPALEVKGLRIAYAATFPGIPVAAEIRDAVEDLARSLGRAGAVVEEAVLPGIDFAAELADGRRADRHDGRRGAARRRGKAVAGCTISRRCSDATGRSSPGRNSWRTGTRCFARCR